MFEEIDEDFKAVTLEQALSARDGLVAFMGSRAPKKMLVGVVGKRDDYGIVVYLPKTVDPTFLIPISIDGIPVRAAHLTQIDKLHSLELEELALWYKMHCAVSRDPIMEGPCTVCGSLGSWETDPYLEDVYNEEKWNFWCLPCYEQRSAQA